MADSFVDYGTGGTLTSDQQDGTFTGITFDYLSITHFEVILTNGSGGGHTTTDVGDKTTLTYAASSGPFTVTTDPSLEVQLDFDNISEWSGLANGDTVRIQRSTPTSALQRTFADGSVLKASDLNAQNKQLLFGLQETTDQGIGSLPLDTDLRFDANNKQIKNLATPTQEHHAVTKAYVDTATLYPGGAPTVDPQAWEFTAAEGDKNGDDRRYTLTDASGSEENFYLIEVDGVLQLPTSYTVVEISDDSYRLTLLDAANEIDNGALISVRNFGTTRNIATSPFTNPGATPDLDLVVAKSLDSDHTGDHYRAESSDGTAHFRVWGNGSGELSSSNVELKLGANADNNSVHENSIRLMGNGASSAYLVVGEDFVGASDTAYGGVLKTEAGDRCILAMQGKSTVPDGTLAYSLQQGSTRVLSWAYNGDFDTAGDMQVDGVFTVGDFNVSATNKSGVEIKNKDSTRGLIRAQADSTVDPTSSAMELYSSDSNTLRVDYDGTIRTKGYIGFTGDPGDARYLQTSAWTSDDDGLTGIIGPALTNGVIGFTSNGPFLQNGSAKGKARLSGGDNGPFIQTRADDILIGGLQGSDGTTPARLTYYSSDYGGTQPAWSDMTDYQVPTKKQIDDEITAKVEASGVWQLLKSLTLDTAATGIQDLTDGVNLDDYDEIRIKVDNIQADQAATYVMFGSYNATSLLDPYGVTVVTGDGAMNSTAGNWMDFVSNASQGNPFDADIKICSHERTTAVSRVEIATTQTNAAGTAVAGQGSDACVFYFDRGEIIRSFKINSNSALAGNGTARGFDSGTVKVYGLKYPS